jgi:hypothetical protein
VDKKRSSDFLTAGGLLHYLRGDRRPGLNPVVHIQVSLNVTIWLCMSQTHDQAIQLQIILAYCHVSGSQSGEFRAKVYRRLSSGCLIQQLACSVPPVGLHSPVYLRM